MIFSSAKIDHAGFFLPAKHNLTIVSKALVISDSRAILADVQAQGHEGFAMRLRKWYIYVLKDPTNNEIKYVGKTVRPNTRLNEHISKAIKRKTNSHTSWWIKKLISMNIEPIMEIIETGKGDNWVEAEMKWIKYYRELGLNITNATDGGEGTLGLIVSINKICTGCGKPYVAHSSLARFCDDCCTFSCVVCGKSFTKREYSRKLHVPKYCSTKCARSETGLKIKICKSCGMEYDSKSPSSKYCDDCCIRTCEYCGNKFSVRRKSPKNEYKYCSKNCLFNSMKGIQPHWLNGQKKNNPNAPQQTKLF